jgi:hypothetical protein
MISQQLTVRLALAVTVLASAPGAVRADASALEGEVRKRATAVEEKVIRWRRDIHQHPELADAASAAAARIAAPNRRTFSCIRSLSLTGSVLCS